MPLESRLAGINLDDPNEVWSQLTIEEREDFKVLVRQSYKDTREIIPEWIPWWTVQKYPLIEEIEAGSSTSRGKKWAKLHAEQPNILEKIPQMSSLTVIVFFGGKQLPPPIIFCYFTLVFFYLLLIQKVKPNDRVKIGLINVVAAYCWTSRLYMGDLVNNENFEEVSSALISLSSFLSRDAVFGKVEEALADVALNACKVRLSIHVQTHKTSCIVKPLSHIFISFD